MGCIESRPASVTTSPAWSFKPRVGSNVGGNGCSPRAVNALELPGAPRSRLLGAWFRV